MKRELNITLEDKGKGKFQYLLGYEDSKLFGKLRFTVRKTYIRVTRIDIKRKERRKGYGSLLMFLVLDHAQRAKIPVLLESSAKAVPFHKSLGFIVEKGKRTWHFNTVAMRWNPF